VKPLILNMTSSPIRYSQEPSLSQLLQPLDQEAIAQVVQMLDDWMADESGYDEATWDDLKQALNQGREDVGSRRLFVE
jgi:hypothetical protein